jgi:hypothetical protein
MPNSSERSWNPLLVAWLSFVIILCTATFLNVRAYINRNPFVSRCAEAAEGAKQYMRARGDHPWNALLPEPGRRFDFAEAVGIQVTLEYGARVGPERYDEQPGPDVIYACAALLNPVAEKWERDIPDSLRNNPKVFTWAISVLEYGYPRTPGDGRVAYKRPGQSWHLLIAP